MGDGPMGESVFISLHNAVLAFSVWGRPLRPPFLAHAPASARTPPPHPLRPAMTDGGGHLLHRGAHHPATGTLAPSLFIAVATIAR